ncbi:hypothetical protein RRG08_033735 [Elysia crispata]|uniref:Uncharacterized protein n=1 Tax=Elysia crispata TaxID=231223 RepID=A0AAE1DVW5_9GAST|nr:hypothetical protein RRG08_033735 [Elysia crispata]
MQDLRPVALEITHTGLTGLAGEAAANSTAATEEISWPSRYHGPADIMAQQISWPSRYHSPADIMAQQISWPSRYHSPADIMAQQIS